MMGNQSIMSAFKTTDAKVGAPSRGQGKLPETVLIMDECDGMSAGMDMCIGMCRDTCMDTGVCVVLCVDMMGSMGRRAWGRAQGTVAGCSC